MTSERTTFTWITDPCVVNFFRSPCVSAATVWQPWHRPHPTTSGSVHNSACANASDAIDRPEPGGPVNNHECVMAPFRSAAARAPGSSPARDIARAARAAASNVDRTPAASVTRSKTLVCSMRTTIAGAVDRTVAKQGTRTDATPPAHPPAATQCPPRGDKVDGMQRLWRNLRWLRSTPWPAYAAAVFLCNLIGAVGVGLFLGVLLPLEGLSGFTELPGPAFIGLLVYLTAAVVAGIGTTWLLFKPVLRWQRHPDLHDPRRVRYLIMRIPVYQAILGGIIWGTGVLLFGIVALVHSPRLGLVVVITSVFGGAIVALMTYLMAERLVRPVAAEALARRAPDSSLEPPIGQRLLQTWLLTSGLPVVAILLVFLAQRLGYFTDNLGDILPAILALAVLALVTGYVGTTLATMSIVDPIRDLTGAVNRVRRGDIDTRVPIYDGSEMGVLQAGFNEMMRGLQERQRVRDLFGRYVGSEVARKALEEKPTLGGEDRLVAVLFVDVIGSTTFAVQNSPEVVVRELNAFFEHVVDCVHRNKGIINKFQGDAALAVFGAPLPLDDTAGHALTAARELRQELRDLKLSAGIGVAAGRVVAGHIGAHDRFEYTVIGDAVNQAARLTELAKDTPGQVLATASTVRLANEDEQARWTSLKSVELRGRTHMTQLARPIRATLADRS